MKIRFLGTGASEGMPAMFCQCEVCKKIHRIKGKEIRTRTQLIINKDLLIDFPSDTYMHFLKYNIDLSSIENMLVTHSHFDHFYPKDLTLRGGSYAKLLTNKKLNIYCNEYVKDMFYEETKNDILDCVKENININIIPLYEKVKIGNYIVTSLKAEHSAPDSRLYLIQEGNKSFLFCCDTGIVFKEVYDYLEKNKINIDCICFDCTMGFLTVGEGKGHMGIKDVRKVADEFERRGISDKNTKYYLTHFSHYGEMLYKEAKKVGSKMNLIPAYDGMEIDL